jgi:hypothetical protein
MYIVCTEYGDFRMNRLGFITFNNLSSEYLVNRYGYKIRGIEIMLSYHSTFSIRVIRGNYVVIKAIKSH